MYIIINELEKDVLREIINIGLARAADSFAHLSCEQVLLDVPDIKIIETKVFPEIIDEFHSVYTVIRSDIRGDLNGKTFMLFPEDHIQRIATACLEDALNQRGCQAQVQHPLLEISHIISTALCAQVGGMLGLELNTEEPEAIFKNEQKTINHIISDLPGG